MNFNFSAVKDTDESLVSKGAVQFGLNQGYVTNFAYNPNGGKDGEAKSAFDLEVTIEGAAKRIRLFEPVGELMFNGNLIGEGDPNYEKTFTQQMTQIVAVIKHAAKAVGLTDAQLDAINAPDFKSFCTAVQAMLPADYKTRLVDVFMEYQWTISEGQNKTFPQLPTNMKGGKFMCPHVVPVGSWKPVIESDGALHYEDDNKSIHPLKKSANFMNSPKGKQQERGGNTASNINLGGRTTGNMEW